MKSTLMISTLINLVLSSTLVQANEFLGTNAGAGNTGIQNVFIGDEAGANANSGSYNSFLGYSAGTSNTTGVNNSFIGNNAGYNTTIGHSNSFLGVKAGYSNTTGHNNSFLGRNAGHWNATGNYNSFLGSFAGYSNTTGHSNNFIGVNAGSSNTTGSYNLFLGNTAGSDETGSNKLYIETDYDSRATPLIYGEFDNDILAVNGTLGIGTQLPTSTVHVQRADGTAQIKVEETSTNAEPRTLFQIANNGNTKFGVLNTQAGVEWAFANGGSDFRLSRQGSGAVEFILTNAGNLTIQGNLTELSSRAEKHNIIAMNSEQVLNKVLALPINEWTYNDSKEGIRHVGPMAEDFHAAFGLGESETGIATLDTSGVALAAIQGLDKKLSEKDAEIAALKKEKDTEVLALKVEQQTLQTELAELKAIVQRLAAKDQWVSID